MSEIVCPLWDAPCSEVSQYCEFWRVHRWQDVVPREPGGLIRSIPVYHCIIGLETLVRNH